MGRFDACMRWFDTPQRKQLGAEFADAHSLGPVPQLIACDSNPVFDDLDEGDDLWRGGRWVPERPPPQPGLASAATTRTSLRTFLRRRSTGMQDAMIAALLNGTTTWPSWDYARPFRGHEHVASVMVHLIVAGALDDRFRPAKGREHKADESAVTLNCGLALPIR